MDHNHTAGSSWETEPRGDTNMSEPEKKWMVLLRPRQEVEYLNVFYFWGRPTFRAEVTQQLSSELGPPVSHRKLHFLLSSSRALYDRAQNWSPEYEGWAAPKSVVSKLENQKVSGRAVEKGNFQLGIQLAWEQKRPGVSVPRGRKVASKRNIKYPICPLSLSLSTVHSFSKSLIISPW